MELANVAFYIVTAVILIFVCLRRGAGEHFTFERTMKLVNEQSELLAELRRDLEKHQSKLNAVLDGVAILSSQLVKHGIEPEWGLVAGIQDHLTGLDTQQWSRQEQIASMQRQLQIKHKELAYLLETKARNGGQADFGLLNKIERVTAEIDKLESALSFLT
jgi:hypothetical protein